MRGFLNTVSALLVIGSQLLNLFIITALHGFWWGLLALVFLPVTVFVGPLIALNSEYEMTTPLILSVFTVLWVTGVAFWMQSQDRRDQEAEDRRIIDDYYERALQAERDLEREWRINDQASFKSLAPALDALATMLDQSYVVDGEIHLDYARFRMLLYNLRDGLRVLDVYLPELNEGGTGTEFKFAVKPLSLLARDGELEKAQQLYKENQWE